MSGVNDCGTICCSAKHDFFEVNSFSKLGNKELAELPRFANDGNAVVFVKSV